jgi:uncharacterized protein YegL
MENLARDTIGGYNAFIENQKKGPGEALVTTVLFDDKYELLYNGVNIKSIPPLSTREYFARGTTALFDAVGKTINAVGENLVKMQEKNRPSKVLVLIITDGYENASKEFSASQIKEMITRQREVYNWEFIFFGANIDSFAVTESIGIDYSKARSFEASSRGLHGAYACADEMVFLLRNES